MSIGIPGIDRSVALVPRDVPDVPVSGDLIGLKHIVHVLRRRLKLQLAIVLLGAAASAALAYGLPQRYTASAEIVLVRNDVRPFDPLGREERDRSSIETEIDVIQSRSLAARVVDRLGLVDDPRFNPYLPPRPSTNAVTKLVGDARRVLSSGADALLGALSLARDRSAKPPSSGTQRDATIANFPSALSVRRTGESRALSISATSDEPGFAMELANTAAAQYLLLSLETKQDPGIDPANAAQVRSAQAMLTSLRGEEARLERERATLAARYGKNHPRMLDAEASVASAGRLVREELDRINSELVNASNKPGARIISSATLPNSPSFPKPKLIMAVGVTGSLMFAIILAMVLEGADTRIRTIRRLGAVSGLRNLGEIPEIPKRLGLFERGALHYLQLRPRSSFAHAIGLLYMRCFLVRAQRSPQVVVVTSSLPQEGKSAIAVGLTAAATADGRKAVLVGFDKMHLAGGRCSATISLNVLTGPSDHLRLVDAAAEGASSDAPDPPPSPPLTDSAATALNSAGLRALLVDLRKSYDVVIVDAPAVLIGNGVNWVTSLADAVLLVVEWSRTKEEPVQEAVASLRAIDAPVMGSVLNRVQEKVMIRQGYGGVVIPRHQLRKVTRN